MHLGIKTTIGTPEVGRDHEGIKPGFNMYYLEIRDIHSPK